jgi:tripartite-type tricarboxylate transporter receptor subunit TctC
MDVDKMRRRTLLSTAGLSAAGMVGAGLAGICGMGVGTRRAVARAAYPSRALTLIVPFMPGSSIGINARLLQPYLERGLGQSVELQFVQGGGGLSGHLLGIEADADGYTMTMVSSSLTAQPWLSRASVAAPDDFAFIGQVTCLPSVLLVRADSPYQSLGELVATARADPGSLTTGTLIGWWPPALALALFELRAAIKPRVVASYYTGSELVVAVSEGQLDFAVVGSGDLGSSLDGRRLRALAVTGRTQALRAVPSFAEQGLDVTIGWWRGLAVPVDTPGEAVVRLAVALQEALESPALRADFGRNGLSVDPLGGPAFRQFVMEEYRTVGGLFSSMGLNVRGTKPT